jgi:hypothetical protein
MNPYEQVDDNDGFRNCHDMCWCVGPTIPTRRSASPGRWSVCASGGAGRTRRRRTIWHDGSHGRTAVNDGWHAHDHEDDADEMGGQPSSMAMIDHVEGRIAFLRAELKITDA